MWTAPSDTHAPGKQNSTPIMDRQLFCPPSSFSPLRSLSLSSFSSYPRPLAAATSLVTGVIIIRGTDSSNSVWSSSLDSVRAPYPQSGRVTLALLLARGPCAIDSYLSPEGPRRSGDPYPFLGSRRKACSSLLNLQRVDFESCALHA